MLDATIKHIFQYTLLSACLFCSFSCGNSKQAEDSEKAEQINVGNKKYVCRKGLRQCDVDD